jgi:hypothetical protein
MVVGCAIGSYETLAGGMIAASAALIAGWLAWSGVQTQIEAEEKQATADRVEVEAVLKDDIDWFAEGLASIWKILETHEEGRPFDQNKVEAINYGIENIAKESWLSTSRRMVSVLGGTADANSSNCSMASKDCDNFGIYLKPGSGRP